VIGGWLVYAQSTWALRWRVTAGRCGCCTPCTGVLRAELRHGKAMIADIVPEAVRGTAYGTYNAVLGILDFPASLIAGVLWDGLPALGSAALGNPHRSSSVA